MGDDGKGVSVLDRMLSQAEAALSYGKTATQTNVVPPSKPPPPPPVEEISLILIDRRALVPEGVRKAAKNRLEADLNALGVVKGEPDVLKGESLRFAVRWESRKPNANQQESYGKWEFPLYLERAHTSDNLGASEVIDTMLAHGIRRLKTALEQFKQAEEGWNDKNVEGLGIQPLAGYRKVGFIKVDLLDSLNDVQTGYVNVIKHEFGHMCNLFNHTSGLMASSVPKLDPKAKFTEPDQREILCELRRLKRHSQAEMERDYLQQKRRERCPP